MPFLNFTQLDSLDKFFSRLNFCRESQVELNVNTSTHSSASVDPNCIPISEAMPFTFSVQLTGRFMYNDFKCKYEHQLTAISETANIHFIFVLLFCTGPFNLQPLFQKVVEKRFQKSGSRKLVREIWFKNNGSSNLDFFSGSRKVVEQKKRWVYTINPQFFQVGEKWFCKLGFFSGLRKMVDQKKNPSLKKHFSKTTFLHFSRKVVAD